MSVTPYQVCGLIPIKLSGGNKNRKKFSPLPNKSGRNKLPPRHLPSLETGKMSFFPLSQQLQRLKNLMEVNRKESSRKNHYREADTE